MRNKKYILIFIELLLLALGVGAYTKDWFGPTLRDSLKQKGYKTIFDSKNSSFQIWVRHYLKHREELLNENIFENKEVSDSEGAFLLKQWCKKSLNSRSHGLFEKAKKYCTMNLEIYALDSKEMTLVDTIQQKKKRRGIWLNILNQNRKKIMDLGILKEHVWSKEEDRILNRFKEWCRKTGDEPYIAKNYETAGHFKSLCVTTKS